MSPEVGPRWLNGAQNYALNQKIFVVREGDRPKIPLLAPRFTDVSRVGGRLCSDHQGAKSRAQTNNGKFKTQSSTFAPVELVLSRGMRILGIQFNL